MSADRTPLVEPVPELPPPPPGAPPVALGRAFEAHAYAASLHRLSREPRTLGQAHLALCDLGYRCIRLPLVAYRTRSGEPQWRTRDGVTLDLAAASSEYVYVHDDGAVVRLFPDAGPRVGFDELSPQPAPFARLSVARVPGAAVDWSNEAAVVSAKRVALPATLRAGEGIRFDRADVAGSYRLAAAVFEAQRIPLRPSEDAAPRLPFVAQRGLSGGLTLVPPGSFAKTVARIHDALVGNNTVIVRDTPIAQTLFFAGNASIARRARSCHGFASLTVHRGAFVLSVDSFGYEVSVQSLTGFVAALMRNTPGMRALDEVTGADVTEGLRRLPTALLGALDPTRVRFAGADAHVA